MCMHGGISRDIESFDQVLTLPKPTDIPDTGIIADLMWNDPDDDVKDWEDNERGCGYVFGKKPL